MALGGLTDIGGGGRVGLTHTACRCCLRL